MRRTRSRVPSRDRRPRRGGVRRGCPSRRRRDVRRRGRLGAPGDRRVRPHRDRGARNATPRAKILPPEKARDRRGRPRDASGSGSPRSSASAREEDTWYARARERATSTRPSRPWVCAISRETRREEQTRAFVSLGFLGARRRARRERRRRTGVDAGRRISEFQARTQSRLRRRLALTVQSRGRGRSCFGGDRAARARVPPSVSRRVRGHHASPERGRGPGLGGDPRRVRVPRELHRGVSVLLPLLLELSLIHI